MAYTTDKKSTGLELLTDLTITQSDLHIVGDVSDSGRAKAITQNLLEDYIANSTNFVDELVANNYFTTELGNETNFINTLTNNTTFQSSVNNFVTVVGGGGGSGNGKPISMSPTYVGGGHQQGYIDKEASLHSNNGTKINFQSPLYGIQSRDITSDWASATNVFGYVLLGNYLYILLAKNSPVEQRLYRYDASDISTGATLMTISGQAFGTTGSFSMTSDGTSFYFNKDAGSNANSNVVAKYTLSGTTLTYVSTTTVGSTSAQFDYFAIDSSGQYFGSTSGNLYIYDNTGSLTDNLPIVGGSGNALFLNWTNTIYYRNANLDLVKLNIPGTDINGVSIIGAGLTTRGATDASSVQVIPHGMGTIPSVVRIDASVAVTSTTEIMAVSKSVYKSSGTPSTSTIYRTYVAGSGTVSGSSTSNAVGIYPYTGTGNGQEATVTVDATNITLTWTKVGTGFTAGTIEVLWEAN